MTDLGVDAEKRISRTISRLIIRHPFYGCLVMALTVQRDDTIKTMATDGVHLFFNPAWVAKLDDEELLGVVVHETQHCANGHFDRRGDRNLKGWNIACDYQINPGIIADGFKLPRGGLIDRQYDGLAVEEIYNLLPEEKKKPKPKKGPGEAAGKPQDGDDADEGGCGGVLDAPAPTPIAKVELARLWEERTRIAIAMHRKDSAGNMDASIKRVADEKAKAMVDWREETRRFISDRAVVDYSWSRPNARMMSHGFILPSTVANGIDRLVIVIDTSGSIQQKALAAFQAEISAALAEEFVSRVTVIYSDKSVRQVDEFERGDDVVLSGPGGGGTSFRHAFQWIADNADDAAAVIFFTDLEAQDFGDDPGVPILWAVWGNPLRYRRFTHLVTFGEIIEVAA